RVPARPEHRRGDLYEVPLVDWTFARVRLDHIRMYRARIGGRKTHRLERHLAFRVRADSRLVLEDRLVAPHGADVGNRRERLRFRLRLAALSGSLDHEVAERDDEAEGMG